ncbi:MAG: hypothetical protein HN350_12430 [Phycisphaerales bacterium]|jgi:hypothetical protein|nr:hypothetical protein [Phycisphaerales bacterium]
MPDLGENQIVTALYAIWDIFKWWFITAGTALGGLIFGICAHVVLVWLDILWILKPLNMGCFSILLAILTTILTFCVPMAIPSGKLMITMAWTNFTVWTILGIHTGPIPLFIFNV